MSLRKFSQFNETDRLRKVIVGRWRGYAEVDEYVETVNEAQTSGFPETDQLEKEFDAFKKILQNHDVEVLVPERVGKFVYDQLTPRDIGVTIGNRFVLCNMAKASRRYESAGIFHHLLQMEGKEPNILVPPDNDMFLEGGDIIVDKGHIFVGISGRTNEKGFRYLRDVFSDEFNVVPVYCREQKEGNQNEVLHLDCVFNCVGENFAIVYRDGIKEIPAEMENLYEFIEIDEAEQRLLATNVLSIDKKTLISRAHPGCERVNKLLGKQGLEVIELDFNAAPATGGSFRCCTLPLVRNN